MWWTEDGDRVMTEAEWGIFNTGLDLLRDFVESDIDSGKDDVGMAGISTFDNLTAEQKLVVLADVAEALRFPEIPSPELTAVNEGAIAAVFETFHEMLKAELGDGLGKTSTSLRKAILEAIGPVDEYDEPPPPETCVDAGEWWIWLGVIADRYFWDSDFDMADEFLDLPPDKARARLEELDIDPDYFLAIPPEPDRAGLNDARRRLARAQGLRPHLK